MNAIAAVFAFAAKLKIYALKLLTCFRGEGEYIFSFKKFCAQTLDRFSRVVRKKRQRSDERIFVPVFVKYIYVVISGAVKNSDIDIERIGEYNKSTNYNKEEHMDKYDAVVIGAGNGGLVAAVRLLQGGAKVLVVSARRICDQLPQRPL